MGLEEAREKQCNWWCAACGVQYGWRDPSRSLVIQDRANPSEGKVFRAHALPQGVCENLVCALKLLANQQTGGDGLVDALFEGFPGAAEDYG